MKRAFEAPQKLIPRQRSGRVALTGAQTAPLQVHAVRDRLHELPLELQLRIVDHLIPRSPYLSGPYGSGVGHMPIAPVLRAVLHWRAACRSGLELMNRALKLDQYVDFCRLASSIAYEHGKQIPSVKLHLVKEVFGADPLEESQSGQCRQLSLSHDGDLQWFVNELKLGAEKLVEIDLQLAIAAPLSKDTMKGMIDVLRMCTGIKSLALRVTAAFPPELFDALTSMAALRTLRLSAMHFPTDLYTRLSSLPASQSIDCLEVHARGALPSLAELAKHALAWPALRFVDLRAGELDERDCQQIASACEALTQLESLHVGTVESQAGQSSSAGVFSISGAQMLVKVLQGRTHISRLGLHNLEPVAGERGVLFSSLQEYAALRELAVSGPLDLACIRHIRALFEKADSQLVSLSLHDCALDEASLAELMQGIRSSKFLHEFQLGRQLLGSVGVSALANALQSNESLMRLGLFYCDLSPNLATALGRGLAASRVLRELHLRRERHEDRQREQEADTALHTLIRLAGNSASLLHMSVSPTGNSIPIAVRNKLATNRRRLEAGINN